MALGNKGFASLVTGERGGEGAPEGRRLPRTGILGARDNRLAELATGGVTTRVHESIDPTVCRIWDGHNRDYAALNEEVCMDLIESLRAQGRQEVPAIVRRVSGDMTYKFEVICGARRHWSVSWLRAHDRPDFKFVVEPRELSDEEAFRIADLENRSRKDLSDYERATDYARAIERYYDGSQQRMVERLQVSKSWLSRYLELAKLPPEVIACFASPHGIGITHAASLAPLLHNMHLRPKILAAAELLKGEQAERAKGGQPPIPPSQVVSKLCLAAAKAKKTAVGDESVLDQTGQLLLKIRQEGRGGVQFSVPRNRLADPKAVAEAIEIWLNQHFKKR